MRGDGALSPGGRVVRSPAVCTCWLDRCPSTPGVVALHRPVRCPACPSRPQGSFAWNRDGLADPGEVEGRPWMDTAARQSRRRPGITSADGYCSHPDPYALEPTPMDGICSQPDPYAPELTPMDGNYGRPDPYAPEPTPMDGNCGQPDPYAPGAAPIDGKCRQPDTD